MSVFTSGAFDNHEHVIFCQDPASGLSAIIAIHSTLLGPAMGGCRMWPYASEEDAVRDVLRLSRGMSYKNAMAELPVGGGKAVIIGDPRRDKSEAMFEALGNCVERLGGEYVTAEDVGVNVCDMEIVARRTRNVTGLPKQGENAGGDPSPKTAYGVFLGILAAVGFQTNEPDREQLDGVRVAVQGLGAVGYQLCRYLHGAGSELIVADIDEDRVARVCAEFGASAVNVNTILHEEVDVLAPCALGAVLNRKTIPKIKATIIAGAANNQLSAGTDGVALAERDILYAPDYVINAGGVINVAYEFLGLGDDSAVNRQVEKIGPRLMSIFQQAKECGRPTNQIADAMAEERLANAAKTKEVKKNAA